MNKIGRFVVLLNLILVLAVTSFVTEQVNDIMPERSRPRSKKRMDALNENFSKISENSHEKTLFVGTSIFEFFLNPEVFNEEMKKFGLASDGYNLSFSGNIGLGMYTFFNRLKNEFSGNKAKFRAVVLEMSPIDFSQKFYFRHKILTDLTNPDLFLDKQNMTDIFLKNPPVATALMFNRLFSPFDWQYVPYVSYTFLNWSNPIKPKFSGVAQIVGRTEFFETPAWNMQTRGLFNWNLPESQELFTAAMDEIHKPENWNMMLKSISKGYGVELGFSYEENLIRYYIDSIKIAYQFSDEVYLLKLPLAPDFQPMVKKYVDEKYLIERIMQETGAKLVDLTDSVELQRNDFADSSHLKHKTINMFIKMLAEKMSSDLKKN